VSKPVRARALIAGRTGSDSLAKEVNRMLVALIALLVILAIFGGLGFAAHFLWWILIAAIVLWVLGFFFRAGTGGTSRWYYW
jgi:hypothetical protein